MRLPQSSNSLLFLRAFLVTTLFTLPAMFPAAAATQQQLICTPLGLKFGTVTVGQSETQLVALTNAGGTSVTVSSSSLNNSEFSLSGMNLPLVIPAGQSVEFGVVFAPTVKEWTTASLTLTSNASNTSLAVPLAGSGVNLAPLTATPAALSFGQVAIGKSVTLPVLLTNTRSETDNLSELLPQGTDFSVSGPTMPMSLSPGQSVKVYVTFTPTATGLTGGSVFIAGSFLNVPFYGTGTGGAVGQLGISPTSINFGSVEVGTTNTQSSSLTATGGSVTVTSASSSNSQFSITGVSFPLTIASGQSVPVSLTFAPSSSGSSSGTLTFVNNGTTTKTQESEAGTGTMPYVTLSWAASTDSISGYNVYRGTAPGSYSKINSSLDPETSYVDKTPAPGTTYYYAATSVDSAGKESTYSEPIEVSIP